MPELGTSGSAGGPGWVTTLAYPTTKPMTELVGRRLAVLRRKLRLNSRGSSAGPAISPPARRFMNNPG